MVRFAGIGEWLCLPLNSHSLVFDLHSCPFSFAICNLEDDHPITLGQSINEWTISFVIMASDLTKLRARQLLRFHQLSGRDRIERITSEDLVFALELVGPEFQLRPNPEEHEDSDGEDEENWPQAWERNSVRSLAQFLRTWRERRLIQEGQKIEAEAAAAARRQVDQSVVDDNTRARTSGRQNQHQLHRPQEEQLDGRRESVQPDGRLGSAAAAQMEDATMQRLRWEQRPSVYVMLDTITACILIAVSVFSILLILRTHME